MLWCDVSSLTRYWGSRSVRDGSGQAGLQDAGIGSMPAPGSPSRRPPRRRVAMRCPYCRHPDSRVVDSREAEDGKIIRRRRVCQQCEKRFTTVEESVVAVVKNSGATEPFNRSKVAAGVMKACQGRPVGTDDVARLAQA